MEAATLSASASSPIAPSEPGTHGNSEPRRRPPGRDLVAHDADMLGLGADEGDFVLFENIGEAGVLGQEAVARMDRVGAR